MDKQTVTSATEPMLIERLQAGDTAALEPLMDRLNSQSWLTAGRARKGSDAETRLTRGVGTAAIGLDAVLAGTTMTLSELRNLEVGDLIVTTRRANEPATLRVEGKPKFTARLGQHRGRRAMQILHAFGANVRTAGAAGPASVTPVPGQNPASAA